VAENDFLSSESLLVPTAVELLRPLVLLPGISLLVLLVACFATLQETGKKIVIVPSFVVNTWSFV